MMPELSPAQRMLIEDGLPASIATMTPEQRREAWKGHRVKPIAGFDVSHPKKPEDPGTIRLLEEMAARAKAEAQAKKLARKEAAAIRARLKRKPEAAVAASSQEPTMKTKTKTTRAPGKKEAQVRALKAKANGKRSVTKAPKPRKVKAAKPVRAAKPKTAAKPAPKARPAQAAPASPATAKSSRVDQAVVLMQRAEGATSDDIAKAIGILEPSARALISKVAAAHKVAKAKREGGKTVYSIAA